MEEIMSSFLDSTGLSRLVSKITDYFAKKDGTYSNMTVGTIRFANATFAGASNGCNILLTDFTTNNTANDQLNARFLVILVRASTGSESCGSAILEISARNPNISPYIPTIHAELNILKYSNIFDSFTINVTKVSDRTIQVYATCLQDSNWGGIRLIPISCGSYGDSTNFAGALTLYNTVAKAASSREGTDVTITRNTTAKIPAKKQVGSTNRPVYVKSDGSVEACFTGIYTIATTGQQYYKLADITFGSNSDIVYAGVQIAATWRNGNGDTGSGIVSITFSEYGTGSFAANVAGRVLVTYNRSNGASFLKDNQIFIVQKNTNYSYTLLLYNSGPQCLSYSLLSGGCTAFTVPSTATVVTPGSNLTKLPYFVPSGTTYTPT
jgi:hypothetical protein